MTANKYFAREWRARLRDVLNTVWDPIGGCPPDEYDHYNGDIAALVHKGVDDGALLDYLHWARTENIGLAANPTQDAATVRAIRNLGPVHCYPGS